VVGHAISTIQTFISPYVMHLKMSPCTDLWYAVNYRILKNTVNLITLLCTELFSKTQQQKKNVTLNGMGKN
jgi:hypothetical protein